jgi:hypothetical protein
MWGIVVPDKPFKITQRSQRRVLAATAQSQTTVERVLVAFINQGFWGRVGWVLFGQQTPVQRWRVWRLRRQGPHGGAA